MGRTTRKIETLVFLLVLMIAALAAVTRRTTSAVNKGSERETISHNMAASQSTTTTTFTQTNLVSDVPGMARITDPNLVNPWGMALGTNSGLWVADNGSGKATTHDGDGNPIPSGLPLVVTVPASGADLGRQPALPPTARKVL